MLPHICTCIINIRSTSRVKTPEESNMRHRNFQPEKRSWKIPQTLSPSFHGFHRVGVSTYQIG